jgi:hypothetical protein
LSRREIRVLSVIGLLFGVGTLYIGATGSCACGEQTVGEPLPFNEFMAEVNAGLVIIILSIIGLVFSSLKRKGPPSEAGRPATP